MSPETPPLPLKIITDKAIPARARFLDPSFVHFAGGQDFPNPQTAITTYAILYRSSKRQ